MKKKITSLTNPRIKQIVRLRTSRERQKTGLTIVEGDREITKALEANIRFKEAYVHCNGPIVKKLSDQKIPIYETSKSVFSKISYGNRDSGVIALCQVNEFSLASLDIKRKALFVIIEQIEKPGNLGAILRSCDGAGVDGLIICDAKTDIYNPNVIRASIGTIFSNKVVMSSNEAALRFLRSKKIQICATSPKAKVIYTKANLKDSVAIVVGSEQQGLSDFWIKHADIKVQIPMKGKADSLNVSASTGILLYEALRQRGL